MRQLPLPVQLRASSLFETFYAGSNGAIVERLKEEEIKRRSFLLWLCGAAGVGKTHLLQAVCAKAGSQNLSASYFPLGDRSLIPDMLTGCESLHVVCLDDFEKIAGQSAWEHAIFRLYTELDDSGGQLLIAAAAPPARVGVVLKDLASRLAIGTVLKLQPLSDDEQLSALSLRATQLGLELPLEVAQFLFRRLARDMATLCDALDKLDRASLATQRKLTVPFVRAVLDEQKTQ